jgi:drug/metabolite transporter (DMT)-like permease
VWILITLAAATFQILRTSEQHRLRSALSVVEAGSVRYLYALPFAAAGLLARSVWLGAAPSVSGRFVPAVVGAGLAQTAGTLCLLQSFRVRDFAVGTVYAKGEVIHVAIASAVLIDELPSTLGWIGVVVVFGGIVALAASGNPDAVTTRVLDPAALLGLAAGGGFALASVGIRSASSMVDGGGAFDHALVTMVAMLAAQSLVNVTGIAAAPNESIRRVFGAWRAALPVGLLSLGGSLGWAWAIALEGPTKVRTLGQIELVLAFAIGIAVHKERHHGREYVATAVIVAGIVAIVVS